MERSNQGPVILGQQGELSQGELLQIFRRPRPVKSSQSEARKPVTPVTSPIFQKQSSTSIWSQLIACRNIGECACRPATSAPTVPPPPIRMIPFLDALDAIG